MSAKASAERGRGDGPEGSEDDDDDNNKKRRRVEEDVRTKALLAMGRYCQEQWVRKMIRLHMSRGELIKLALLSGDAGCGKSYALSLLLKKLRSMNVSAVVSAMTNKAAGALMETGSLDCVYTFHKMMGFNKDLLDDSLSLEEFTRRYCEAYGFFISRFDRLRRSDLPPDDPLAGRHACARPRPESCAVCSKMFERLRVRKERAEPAPMENCPPFLGANVLIVDEYGLMNAELLERMLRCLALFYGPEKGPLIVFAGSVSQLQPVGSNARIWETERFEGLLSSRTQLFVNRRQFEDPGYAEAVTYLQFNTVTEESRRIFRSQAVVREPKVMDPAYEPHKLRIFHQDDQLLRYTAAYMKKVAEKTRLEEKFLSVVRHPRASSKGPRGWYDVLKQAAQALPKLFSVPRYRPGIRSSERDYLKVDKLWVGCRVRMIWHMDVNGIQVVNRKASAAASSSSIASTGNRRRLQKQQQQQQERPSIADTEGVVQSVSFKREGQFNEFYVKGDQTGTLYRVAPSNWNYMNWTVTTHPLACLLAMNTYDCQGCTVHGQVLYHPPRHFLMSPIKPSVYVVLTRVVKRENLQMTNSNFAETIGPVPFYDKRLVAYRKRVEMNYSS